MCCTMPDLVMQSPCQGTEYAALPGSPNYIFCIELKQALGWLLQMPLTLLQRRQPLLQLTQPGFHVMQEAGAGKIAVATGWPGVYHLRHGGHI
jgi:hypothetical protein